MNAFQSCPNTTDAVPLYLPQQLYLKPIARICINVQLPTKKMIGKAVSNWELMDQLRTLIRPDEFTHLKVTKTTAEFIRFEAEVEHKTKVFRVMSKLDRKLVKLKDIPDYLKVKAAEAKLEFPTRQAWDDFFANSKEMNEMKPGERPDTVHLSNLPTKWFVPYHMTQSEMEGADDDMKPSEKIFYRIFEKFGHIRAIDIPICDPYRHRMKTPISGLQTTTFDEASQVFEGYIQFRDYIGFTKCMDALRNMKLLRKEHPSRSRSGGGGVDEEAIAVNMVVDFDRSKHLSEAAIKRREIVRERLVLKEVDRKEKVREVEAQAMETERAQRQKELDLKSEKEKRRTQREERRKAKILSQLKMKGNDEINDKIAKEEKKLLQVQRKLESIRIVEELFKRIKNKKEYARKSALQNRRDDEDELTRMKRSSELEVQQQKEKLNKAARGGEVLKSILATPRRRRNSSTSSSSSNKSKDGKAGTSTGKSTKPNPNNIIAVHAADMMFPANQHPVPHGQWYGPPNGLYPYNGQQMGPSFFGQPGQQMAGMQMAQAIRPEDEYYNPQVINWLRTGGAPGGWNGPQQRGGQYQRRPRGIFTRGRGGGGGRGQYNRMPLNNACYYPPDVQDEYYRYFQKFLKEPEMGPNMQQRIDHRRSRSDSRSRSRSRGRQYLRRNTKSRSRSRRRRSHSRNRSRSDRRSRSKSSRRSRSRDTSRDRSRSKGRSRERSRSRRRSRSKDGSRDRSRSKGRARSKSRSRDRRSRSGDRSVRATHQSRSRRSRSRSRSRSHSDRKQRHRSRTTDDNTGSNRPPVTPLPTENAATHRASRSGKSESRSPSVAKSVDSSGFIPPNRQRRSSGSEKSTKSWSVPIEDASSNGGEAQKKTARSWSKSPEGVVNAC